MVQTWIFAANTYGRVAAHIGEGAGRGHHRDGRGPLEGDGPSDSIDRRLARWCDRLVGNSHAVVDFYRRLGVPDDRLAMIYSGIADEEPPPVDPAAVRAEFGFAGRLRPWSSSPAGWPSRSGSTTCSRRSTCSSTCSPICRTLIAGDGPLRARLEETARAYRPRRQGPVPGPSRRRPPAAGRGRSRRPAQRLRGPAQPGARGHAVPQAGGRHRRPGNHRGRRRRPDRRPRARGQPPAPGPGDPRPGPRSRPRAPPGRGRAGTRRGRVPGPDDGRPVRRLYEELAGQEPLRGAGTNQESGGLRSRAAHANSPVADARFTLGADSILA